MDDAVTVIFFFDIYRRKIKSAMLWTWSEEVCHALRNFCTVLDVTDTCTTVEKMTDSTGKHSCSVLVTINMTFNVHTVLPGNR